MKNIIVLTICFLGYLENGYSQSNLVPLTKMDTLLISDVKTTHLLFNEDIRYVDIGSSYFVADTLKRIIRLKHIGQELNNVKSSLSNLTVITNDGGFYSMVLEYDRLAPLVSYQVTESQDYIEHYLESENKVEEEKAYYGSLCDQTERLNSKILLRNKKGEDLEVFITGIFYIDEKIGIRMEIQNRSTIDFDIDQILFRTKLKKKISPDYLYQERVTFSKYTCSDNVEILGNGEGTITVLFDKFMPNKKEELFIDLFEQNGGRSASVLIPRRKLLKPKIVYSDENR